MFNPFSLLKTIRSYNSTHEQKNVCFLTNNKLKKLLTYVYKFKIKLTYFFFIFNCKFKLSLTNLDANIIPKYMDIAARYHTLLYSS